MNDLKTLTSVELSEVWENEPEYFTPWLARDENLTLLGEALGMELELVLCQSLLEGYSFLSLIRASSVVNRQWTVVPC